MTELIDLVEAYKREVAVPGTFSEAFPSTTDTAIQGALADAFAEAQLDGFFHSMTIDLDAYEVTPDLSAAGAALVVIYAGIRLARQQIRTLRSTARYKAGPVEYETGQAASALAEDLKYLRARRTEILDKARYGSGTAVFMLDNYVARERTNFYGALFPYEVGQVAWRELV